MFQQPPSGFRKCDSTPIPFKKHLPELQLKGTHLSAQDGLCDRKEVCCPREAAQFGYVDEIFQLSQFHGAS
jgi:hypothetical protein